MMELILNSSDIWGLSNNSSKYSHITVLWTALLCIGLKVAQLYVRPLWANGGIWRWSSGSTLAQVIMACCLAAPSHYTWTKVDMSPVKSNGIHLMAISLEIHQASVSEINFEITDLKVHSNLPGPNELTLLVARSSATMIWKCWINGSLSSTRKYFDHLRHLVFLVPNQIHGCWYPGSHGIYLLSPEYFNHSTLKHIHVVIFLSQH